MRFAMDLSMFNINKTELFRIIKEISSIASYDPNKVSKILINAKVNDIILIDTQGAIYLGRKEGMNPFKEDIAKKTN